VRVDLNKVRRLVRESRIGVVERSGSSWTVLAQMMLLKVM
jgi:hypothetical protein